MRRVSFLPNSTKRLSIEYSLQHATCTTLQQCPLAQIHNVLVSMGTLRAQHKKHHLEHRLSDIFEVL
jgi:polysaccharide deacetylase 2 family uncharacterized protein YibQ